MSVTGRDFRQVAFLLQPRAPVLQWRRGIHRWGWPMALTVATAEEMAEHERRVTLGRPWPLVGVVWFERAQRHKDGVDLVARLNAAKPDDLGLWLSLAKFFEALR